MLPPQRRGAEQPLHAGRLALLLQVAYRRKVERQDATWYWQAVKNGHLSAVGKFRGRGKASDASPDNRHAITPHCRLLVSLRPART